MKFDIQIQEWALADLDQMAHLAWQARAVSPLRVEGQTVDDFKNYLLSGKERWPETILICAEKDHQLVGWLGLDPQDPLVFELWRCHLQKNQLGTEAEIYYQQQGKRYHQAGLPKTDETVYMTCATDEFAPPPQTTMGFEPHYDLITAPDQVQIYETLLKDVSGQFTTVLLAAADYHKDNRLLPTGFDKASASPEIQPWSGAVIKS